MTPIGSIGIGIEEQTATVHSLLIPYGKICAQMYFRVRSGRERRIHTTEHTEVTEGEKGI